MTYDTDLGETSPDADKHSKRERFRDALTRTKSKFKKEKASSQDDFKLSDDVNDFLAAGRQAAASKPAIMSPLPLLDDHAPRPFAPEQQQNRPPSRGALVPKIDVSQSTRWPNARIIENEPQSADHLHPGRRNRSQSFGALGKKKPRPRGLGVSFDDGPPVVIGEGGDEATTPPNEISKAKQRARSLSPVQRQPLNLSPQSPVGQSPIRRRPVSPRTSPSVQEHHEFIPRPVRRVQTGLAEDEQPKLSAAETLERQLRKALVLDQDGSAYFAQPQHMQQSPASYINQQAKRSNTTEPMMSKTEAVTQLQHYGVPQAQHVPQPVVRLADPSHRVVPPHPMINDFTKPPQPSLDEKPPYKHQQMQQQPPNGWI